MVFRRNGGGRGGRHAIAMFAIGALAGFTGCGDSTESAPGTSPAGSAPVGGSTVNSNSNPDQKMNQHATARSSRAPRGPSGRIR